MRKALLLGTGILVVAVALLFAAAPPVIESRLNRVEHRPPYQVSKTAQQLHSTLTIVDLHADTLLWGRDINSRSTRGHVDIPRLIDANVAIQAFTVVTKAPRSLNVSRTEDKNDMVRYLAVAEHWPPATWNSLLARAMYQAATLQRSAAASQGRLVVIRTKSDLVNYLQSRQTDPRRTAAFLGLEGAHALEGNPANIDPIYDAGFRMIAPTHFFDTDMSGAASGVTKGGLTAKGREMVKRAESKHMLIDLAHASTKTIDDATAMATRPVVVSHTGVRGTCDNPRNLADKQLKEIAATGGVIGIGYWRTATCGDDAHAVARAIRYTVNVVGVEHVALGSDFDGAVTQPFDVTGLPMITEALMKKGFSPDEIRLIMGGNAVRVLREVLPD